MNLYILCLRSCIFSFSLALFVFMPFTLSLCHSFSSWFILFVCIISLSLSLSGSIEVSGPEEHDFEAEHGRLTPEEKGGVPRPLLGTTLDMMALKQACTFVFRQDYFAFRFTMPFAAPVTLH